MKFLRWLVYCVVIVVFIIPVNVIVTVSTDEEQYREFKINTQDKILDRLKRWARGQQHTTRYRNTRTLIA